MRRSGRYRFRTFLLLLLVGQESLAVDSADAIVAVTAYTSDAGRRGTGFVLAPGGEVVTCYHTVVGALRIEVEVQNRSYQASVERLAPAHDLAALRADLPEDQVALQMFGQDAESLVGQDLTIIGHGVGLRHLTTQARMAQRGWVGSEQLRVNGERMFSSGSRFLMLEAAAVQDGMSGAPILFNNTAVAVLCGSLTTGGDLAWGMDVHQLLSSPVSRMHAPMHNWPRFRLLRTSHWRTLLRNASLTGIRGEALTRYYSDWQASREVYMDLLAELSRLRNMIDRATAIIGEKNMPTWLLDEQKEEIVAAIDRVATADDSYDQAISVAATSSFELFDKVWEIALIVPRTQENLEVMDEFMGDILPVFEEQTPSVDSLLENRARILRMDERFETIRHELGESSLMLPRILPELASLVDAKWDWAIEAGESSMRSRNLVATQGKLLFLETQVKPWIFRGKGFDLSLPAGWAQLRAKDQNPPYDAVFRNFEEIYAGQGYPVVMMAKSDAFPGLRLVISEVANCGQLPGFKPIDISGANGWFGEASGLEESHIRKIIYACRPDGGYYFECSIPKNKEAQWTKTCLDIGQTLQLK